MKQYPSQELKSDKHQDPYSIISKLEEENARLREQNEMLKASEKRYCEIVENAKAGYYYIDEIGCYKHVNQAWLDMHGYDSEEEVVGLNYSITQADPEREDTWKLMKGILSGEAVLTGESRRRCKDGSIGYHIFTAHPVIKDFEIIGFEGFIIDTTKHVKAIESLRQKDKELEAQNILLEEKNNTLQQFMDKLENEKNMIEDRIRNNIEQFILPLLNKLKDRGSNIDEIYLDLIEENLRRIASPFGKIMAKELTSLSSREREICNLIKNGLTSKKIAELLGISVKSVDRHRNNIRNKLELTNKKIRLETYLNSL